MSGPPQPILLDQPQKKVGQEEESYERDCYKRWMDELEASKKVFKPWWERGKKILKLYKDERASTDMRTDTNSHRMNILWSNVQTLQPAIYSKTPKPNISRRYSDEDPVARCASLIMERCLNSSLELCDFDYPMKRARDDYLLPGRGWIWVRYDPVMGSAPLREPLQQQMDDKTGQPVYRTLNGKETIPGEKVKSEEGAYYYETDPESIKLDDGLAIDHLVWTDVLHEAVNDWTKVDWAGKKVLMKRPKLRKMFGDKGKKVHLNKTFNAQPSDSPSDTTSTSKPDCAEVWEIWCKSERKVYWLTDGLPDEILKEEEDPLKLTTFWPFPRPMSATTTTDSLIPVPDYCLYQDQAEQLDRLTDRIRLLIKALRVVGFYDGSVPELQQLLEETEENAMIPVASFIAFVQNGGMKGLVDWLPIEQIAAVLTQLFQARAQIKQDLYEVTGMSDIIRGQTNPDETATAQQIKGNFATLRLQDRQTEMSRLCRDTIRIMGEIQVEHYDAKALIEMSAIHNTKDGKDPKTVLAALDLLKNDRLRSFRIDIETDATVAADQEAEKRARVEFLQALTPFLEKATIAGQQFPKLQPLILDLLKFGVQGFRVGRSIEASIDEMAAQLAQETEQAKGQTQQDPKAMQAQLEAQQAQAEQALKQQQAGFDAQMEQMKAANAKEVEALKAELAGRKINNEYELKKAESDAKIRLIDAQISELEAKVNSLTAPQPTDPLAQPRAAYEADRLAYDNETLAVSRKELAARSAKAAAQMNAALNGAAPVQ